jgi:hypothetical protein
MVHQSPEKKSGEQADIRVKWSVEGLKKESEERADIRVKRTVEGLRKESVETVDLRVKWTVELLRKECSGLKNNLWTQSASLEVPWNNSSAWPASVPVLQSCQVFPQFIFLTTRWWCYL